MTKIRLLQKIALLAVVCCTYGVALGQTPISTVADLKALRTDAAEAADKSYILMNDIDLSGEVWTEAQLIWSFKGVFDGNGHVIKNFSYNGTAADAIGFFRFLRGTVKNLGFENANVNGLTKPCGVIVGYIKGGTIENCFVKNSTVTGSNERIGGIVGNVEKSDGLIAPIIKNCSVQNCTITGNNLTGGILGRAAEATTIENCAVESSTIYGSQDVGGVVGRLVNSTLKTSYSAYNSVSGNDNAGGVVGRVWGASNVQDTYCASKVESRSWQAGGIVGQGTDGASTISRCYFSGIVIRQGTNRASGILGLAGSDGHTIQNCVNVADQMISDEKYRIVSFGGKTTIVASNNYALETLPVTTGTAAENGTNVSTADAKTQTFYQTTLGWDFTNIWKMLNDGYPVLKWQTSPVNVKLTGVKDTYVLQNGGTINLAEIKSLRGLTLTFTSNSPKISIVGSTATVTGTINGPESTTITITANNGYTITNNTLNVKLMPTGAISIATPADFVLVTSNPTMDFELANDIDMTGVSFTGLCSSTDPFKGKFDGKGHIIRNVTFDNQAISGVGLFVKISGATIQNLGIKNANFGGNEDVGAIVGYATDAATIKQCYVVNSAVNGRDRAGSIVGKLDNNSMVTNCYAVATNIIGREHQCGGLVGATAGNGGVVSNSYFAGTVTGRYNRSCGILGLMDTNSANNKVENCVNLASALSRTDGTGNVFRIADSNGNGSLINNYSLSTSTVSGAVILDTDGEYGAAKKHGVNIATNDEKLQSFYTGLGWDFTTIWKFASSSDYPVLKVFPTDISTQLEKADAIDFQMFVKHNTLNIKQIPGNSIVTILTIDGRIVSKTNATNEFTYQLPAKGCYIVNIFTTDNKSVTKKVIAN